jgi:O-antigen ligase
VRQLRTGLESGFLGILFIIPILVTPRTTIDVFALPKSLLFVTGILVLTSFMMLYGQNVLAITKDKLSLVFIALALCTLIIPILSNSFSEERLFGVHGRFNGALVYFSLILSLLFIRIMFKAETSLKLLKLGAFANLIVGSYFIVQWTGKDFLGWQDLYQNPSSTMGNPNFVSGFLATTSFCYFGFANSQSNNSKKVFVSRAFSIFGFGFSITSIALTNSSLGLIAVLAGLSLILCTWLIRKFSKVVSAPIILRWISLVAFLAVVVAIPVILAGNRLELTSSISNRLYYWSVSLAAIWDRPLQGYGFDSTGDFFRTMERVDKFGPTFGVDSSHNLIIDLISWMGIPLSILLVSIILIPIVLSINSQITKLPLSSVENLVAASVITFLAQAVISVPTIGVNCWGFAFLGILWNLVRPIEKSEAVKVRHIPTKSLRVGAILLFLLLLPLFPMRFAKDVEFRKSAERGNGVELIRLVQKWPQDSYQYLALSHSLYRSNQASLAREIAKRGIEFNSKNYLLLDEVYREEKDLKYKDEILEQMKAINPLLK